MTGATKRAWLWGGIALIASAIAQFALPSNLSGRGLISALLLAAGLMLFTFGGGIGRNILGGDVIGAVAAVLLSALMIVTGIIELMPNAGGPEWNQLWVGSLIGFARLALAIVLAVQVGRSPLLSTPWRWAPFWAVLAELVSWVALQFGLINAVSAPAGPSPWVTSWTGVIVASVPIFIGVLGILVAKRPDGPENASVRAATTEPARSAT
jgi:hypothetical protein